MESVIIPARLTECGMKLTRVLQERTSRHRGVCNTRHAAQQDDGHPILPKSGHLLAKRAEQVREANPLADFL
jgi:hypothetical protein